MKKQITAILNKAKIIKAKKSGSMITAKENSDIINAFKNIDIDAMYLDRSPFKMGNKYKSLGGKVGKESKWLVFTDVAFAENEAIEKTKKALTKLNNGKPSDFDKHEIDVIFKHTSMKDKDKTALAKKEYKSEDFEGYSEKEVLDEIKKSLDHPEVYFKDMKVEDIFKNYKYNIDILKAAQAVVNLSGEEEILDEIDDKVLVIKEEKPYYAYGQE